MKTLAIIPLLIAGLLMSCSSKSNLIHTDGHYDSLRDTLCVQSPEFVELFELNREIPFRYTELGLVDANAKLDGPYADERYRQRQSSLQMLKYIAWCNCANAVIQVRGDSGQYAGVAVNMNSSAYYNAAHADTSFVYAVNRERAEHKQEAEKPSFGNVILSTGVAMLTVWILSLDEE